MNVAAAPLKVMKAVSGGRTPPKISRSSVPSTPDVVVEKFALLVQLRIFSVLVLAVKLVKVNVPTPPVLKSSVALD